MFDCKICNEKFSKIVGLSLHLIQRHNIKLLQYYIDYEKFIIPKCECGEDLKYINGLNFQKTCGDKECLKSHFIKVNKMKMNNETRLKISNSMKKLSKDGKLLGWAINKDKERRSYPEKFFIKLMEMNNLYSQFIIKEKLSFNKYFLDFAFVEMKIDVEIDGQQHYITQDAIDYDNERDNFVMDSGWKVYRINWLELKKEPKKVINNLIIWLSENSKYRKYDISKTLEELKPKQKKNYIRVKKPKISKNQKIKKIKITRKRNEYFLDRKNHYDEKIQPIINKILNSDIDFSKYGWVKEVSKLIGISENKGGFWLKKNMNDFYNKKCCKRNAPII